MSNVRIESDTMGEIEVASDRYWGAQTQRSLENFKIGDERMPRPVLRAMGIIKHASAIVNQDLGKLDAGIADAIRQAGQQVIDAELDDHFPLVVWQTGSGTQSNMNANEVIAALANRAAADAAHVHANDHVNYGQSSNDIIPTAIHVSCRAALNGELVPALGRLRDALAEKARDFDGIVKSGRTHLMDATPVRLGQEFGGYARQATLGMARVERAGEEMAEVALGGTATGTGINAHPEFAARTISKVAATYGIDFREAENHFEAQGAKDACVSLAGALNTVAASLMKIADDMRWLASGPTSGISEIQLPAVQPGSSIMPGKVNPVMCEALMMVCARVMGNATTVTIGGQRGNFELNVMMPVMADALLESITLLANAATVFADRCITGITARPERARELLERNPSIATALNARIGYDKATVVAKKAAHEGRSVREVVEEMGLIDSDELDDALDVRQMTEPGVPGSA
jgi:fumarate hydratase class II